MSSATPARTTTNYEPARGNVSSWGDNYGTRVGRFLAGRRHAYAPRPTIYQP